MRFSGGCLSDTQNGEVPDLHRFFYTAGSTQIRMIDSSDGDVVCVDFGSNPANGGRITTETCDDDATGQRLYTTDDDHIAMENGPGQCMDVQAESGPLPIRLYGVLKSI